MTMTLNKEIFWKVDVKSINLDLVLSLTPEGENEATLLHRIKEAVYTGNVKTFWAPCLNPSLDPKTKQIQYKEGEKACTMSTKLWKAQAELFSPERKSRMATKNELNIYLAYIIGNLVEEEKYDLKTAYDIVINKKKAIAKYVDTKMSFITLTGDAFELWDLSKKLWVPYNFNYCEQAVGLVVLTQE